MVFFIILQEISTLVNGKIANLMARASTYSKMTKFMKETFIEEIKMAMELIIFKMEAIIEDNIRQIRNKEKVNL